MSILVDADFTPKQWATWLPALQRAMPQEALMRERGSVPAEDIEVAIVANAAPGALAGLPRLRLIQSLWAGVEDLLADASLPAGVPLARMVDPAMSEAMAETALWSVLSLHRDHFRYARQQHDARLLALLPRGASVVNLARGAHLVEADLLAALANGHIGHAVLDVFATEPLPAAHPFWAHPQVTVLPHVAAQTDPRGAATVVAANVAALRAGRPLRHFVDRMRGY